jgi:hypothetical protein
MDNAHTPALLTSLSASETSQLARALIAEYLFDSIDDFFGLVHDFLDQLFQLLAGRRIDIHLGLFGFEQKLRIL